MSKAAIFVLLFSICFAANAHKANKYECFGRAQIVLGAAEMKMVNVPEESATKALMDKAKQATVSGVGQLVQDEDDIRGFLGEIHMVYSSEEDHSPGEWYDSVLFGCLKAVRGDKSDMPDGVKESGPQIQG